MREKIDKALQAANEEYFDSNDNFSNEKVIIRLNILKPKFEDLLKREISNDEFIEMLDLAMNCNEMQIWLLRNSFNHIVVTKEEKLAKFFDITSDERVLFNYSCN